MVKTNHLGALAATAGALVAVGLLMLMMLVVEVRPAEATFAGKPKVGGGSEFNVTDNTTNDYTPSYSPNGREIVYRGIGFNGGRNEIYTIKVNGEERLQVTNDTKNERDPSYLPSGKRIAYAGYDGEDWEIYTINASGGGRVQITNNAIKELDLAYSPDGKKIAYTGYEGLNTDNDTSFDPDDVDHEIYTIDVGGGGKSQVTDTKYYAWTPSWGSRP
jgi:Tol biopolymer transport system component